MVQERENIILKAGESIARFSAFGAECRGWTCGGREMMWSGDPAIWSGVAPVLFPTCGWSRDEQVRVGDRVFPMPVHGFAASLDFDVKVSGEDEVGFVATSDARTLAHFPFAFRLAITYRLSPDVLAATICVENTGATPMPYACGLHPGFVWDPQAGRQAFVFSEPVRPEVPVIAPGGLFSARRRPLAFDGRRLDLAPDLFAAEALCFLDVPGRVFAFEAHDGTLHIDAPDFPHLVLWSRDGAPFLAIESWTGTGDPEHFTGDLMDRPSMIHLAPGAQREHRVTYRWAPTGP